MEVRVGVAGHQVMQSKIYRTDNVEEVGSYLDDHGRQSMVVTTMCALATVIIGVDTT